MSRLIDADALLEKLKGTPRYFDLKGDIEEQPTAYDVEKVISELETLKSRYGKEDFSYIGIIEKAIEIIRKGGVE